MLESERASSEYKEALEIRRNLYGQMPNVYTPDLANTLINLAIFYKQFIINREKSIEYVIEALILLRPIVEVIPFTQSYMQRAIQVLRNWGLNDDKEIERLIEEKMKETGEDTA